MFRSLDRWLSILCLFSIPIAGNAQSLYTCQRYNGSSTVQVNSINLSTGALTPVAITDASDIVDIDSAIDPVGHRLFFVGSTGLTTSALYIVNLTTGSFSKLPGSFSQLEFDSGSGTLYTYQRYNGSSTVQVNSINLSTGALTPVASTDASDIVDTDAAIDPVGHRLFFVGSTGLTTSALYIVNLTTGSFSKLPGSFSQLEFDSGSGTLYTYQRYNGSSTVQVNSINLSTGALTPAATTDASDIVDTDAAIDPVGHRLFFVGSTGLTTSALYTVNLTTGSFSKLPGSFSQLEFATNPTPVPAVSSLSLLFCGLGTVAVAWKFVCARAS